MACLAVLLVVLSLSDAAITNTPQSVSACNGRYVNLKWTFDTANFFAAEWKINGSLMLQYAPIGNPQLNYYNGYTNATLIHVTNGEINITSLTTSNSGNYSCTVTYSSGSPLSFETEMMLTVYDMISTNLSCSYNQSVGKIDCSVIPVSILSVTVNGAVHSTSSLPISVTAGSAKYTVCMTGDAAECRNDGILPCVSIEGQSASSNPSKSCGINVLGCLIGSLLGNVIVLFLYHKCILRICLKIIWIGIVIFVLVCCIFAAVICHFYCFDNVFYGFITALVISLVLTLIVVAIIYSCRKKGKTNKQKETLTPGKTNKQKETLTPDTMGKKDQNPIPVPLEKVMVLVKSVDTELISAFEWISEIGNLSKDRDTNRLKYSYGSSPLKVSLVINSLSKEDSGIYQCVRTLQHEVKDKINVVLYVSNACPIWLIVNPFVWEDESFEDLSPVDLKKIVTKVDRNSIDEVIETRNSHDGRKESSVDWEFSSKPIEEGEIKMINGSTILSAAHAGEYRCTVHLKQKTYVFIFYIHYLGGRESRPQTNEHVFGVPSMLNSNREKSKTGRKQKTRSQKTAMETTKHTGTSHVIHEESIEEQVTAFHLPHTIQKNAAT